MVLSTHLYANSKFVDYYNKSSHWTTNQIANGTLIIDETVNLHQNVVLPDDVEVVINGNGNFANNGYKFSITGDPDNPTEEDPKLIYMKSRNMIPMYYLLLTDNIDL